MNDKKIRNILGVIIAIVFIGFITLATVVGYNGVTDGYNNMETICQTNNYTGVVEKGWGSYYCYTGNNGLKEISDNRVYFNSEIE